MILCIIALKLLDYFLWYLTNQLIILICKIYVKLAACLNNNSLNLDRIDLI